MIETKILKWLERANGVMYSAEELWEMQQKEVEFNQKKMNEERLNHLLNDIPTRFRYKTF